MTGRGEAEFFGRLVLRGHLAKELVEALFAEAQKRQQSLSQLAVEKGWFDADRLEFLRTVEGEDVPALPGYDYLGVAGRGGTAVVIHARERKTKREVAIKVLHRALSEDPNQARSFLREAKLLLSLKHENVVSGLNVGTWKGRHVFLMEYIPGSSLQELISAGQSFDEDSALFIVLQVARALRYLSEKGVVHRDIKPGNVLLTRDNRVKLIDLGFATSAGGEGSETTVGTVAYMAPEQARGEADLDVRSDIYSLGATLYQLVVGKLPFDGESNQEVMAAQILASLSSAELKSRNISPYMHYFIEKMMAKERDIRYQSPDELIADIENQIRGRKSLEFDPGQDGPTDDEELLKKPFAENDAPTEQPPQRFPNLRRRRRR